MPSLRFFDFQFSPRMEERKHCEEVYQGNPICAGTMSEEWKRVWGEKGKGGKTFSPYAIFPHFLFFSIEINIVLVVSASIYIRLISQGVERAKAYGKASGREGFYDKLMRYKLNVQTMMFAFMLSHSFSFRLVFMDFMYYRHGCQSLCAERPFPSPRCCPVCERKHFEIAQ